LSWTSDASGNATFTTDGISGAILRVVTNPDDAAAPTDNYNVTLRDADGVDVLSGQGAARDAVNAEHFCPGVLLSDGATSSVVPVVVAGKLTLGVTGAGNAKKGSLTVYYR
jgi:hypothetical protein